MAKLTKKQVRLIEEVVWLAKAACESSEARCENSNHEGEVAIAELLTENTLQQRILRRYIDNLSSKQRATLQAVLSLGTGHCEKKDFPRLVRNAQSDSKKSGENIWGADDVSGKLLAGLERLGVDAETHVKISA